ncbi:MAG: hypothetical protein MK098_14820 [Marinovum sp.]|nr:hypothetical protein [Marinovum sp.]
MKKRFAVTGIIGLTVLCFFGGANYRLEPLDEDWLPEALIGPGVEAASMSECLLTVDYAVDGQCATVFSNSSISISIDFGEVEDLKFVENTSRLYAEFSFVPEVDEEVMLAQRQIAEVNAWASIQDTQSAWIQRDRVAEGELLRLHSSGVRSGKVFVRCSGVRVPVIDASRTLALFFQKKYTDQVVGSLTKELKQCRSSNP